MLYLLTINDLALRNIEKNREIKKKNIKEDISNYTEDQFENTLRYSKNTNENDINKDDT